MIYVKSVISHHITHLAHIICNIGFGQPLHRSRNKLKGNVKVDYNLLHMMLQDDILFAPKQINIRVYKKQKIRYIFNSDDTVI